MPPAEDGAVVNQGRDHRDLAARAAAGDRAAFEALAADCREPLEALVRQRLGKALLGAMSVEDVLQETFLRALRSIQRFEPREERAFLRWLGGIAMNVIREAAARPRHEPLIALEDFEPAAAHVSPSRRLQREERLARLEEALATLSPEHRRVLRLVRLEGLPINETARRLNRSPNAVSHLLLRALRKLRERFGDTESLGLPPRRLRPGRGSTGEDADEP
jgi:RNA polymerase sigma-70 factor (ECF subfamily)